MNTSFLFLKQSPVFEYNKKTLAEPEAAETKRPVTLRYSVCVAKTMQLQIKTDDSSCYPSRIDVYSIHSIGGIVKLELTVLCLIDHAV